MTNHNTAARRRVRLLLVDDHPHGREGMRMIVEGDPLFEIVGEAASGEEALAMNERLAPEMILMDISMPGIGGLEATRRIKAASPEVKIVMVTVSDDITHLFEALRRGAQGYLLKNLTASSWLEYLSAVAVDEAPMSKGLAMRLLQEFASGGEEPPLARHEASGTTRPKSDAAETMGPGGMTAVGRPHFRAQLPARPPKSAALGTTPLTPRELEVLERVAHGESNREIAESFGISEHTVKNHLKHILQKLHLANRVQLTRYAYEQGYVNRRE
ncbi:DNA-binding response regulator [Paenibacillus sp. 598K]|uniref:response regulator n=1 Tax=Paenibacillus sp. 598K TaxID=1117987 RepID=UPI000FFA3FF6|nr:response regulator transcription factor [Paenibacillus sp. 598K]GBF74082.1 DNA-binding response regulator [Paenibacillus sp. 598K]